MYKDTVPEAEGSAGQVLQLCPHNVLQLVGLTVEIVHEGVHIELTVSTQQPLKRIQLIVKEMTSRDSTSSFLASLRKMWELARPQAGPIILLDI